jgi:hypothetical protein
MGEWPEPYGPDASPAEVEMECKVQKCGKTWMQDVMWLHTTGIFEIRFLFIYTDPEIWLEEKLFD